jgi:uncharacterized protein YjbJ (UPF0337 family)
MNKDIAAGKWKQLKGKVQQSWGDLTDDEIDKIQGSQERFVGLMQERYGLKKDEAEREFQKLVA